MLDRQMRFLITALAFLSVGFCACDGEEGSSPPDSASDGSAVLTDTSDSFVSETDSSPSDTPEGQERPDSPVELDLMGDMGPQIRYDSAWWEAESIELGTECSDYSSAIGADEVNMTIRNARASAVVLDALTTCNGNSPVLLRIYDPAGTPVKWQLGAGDGCEYECSEYVGLGPDDDGPADCECGSFSELWGIDPGQELVGKWDGAIRLNTVLPDSCGWENACFVQGSVRPGVYTARVWGWRCSTAVWGKCPAPAAGVQPDIMAEGSFEMPGATEVEIVIQ